MKRVFIIVAVVVFAVAAGLPGVAALAQPGDGGFFSVDPSAGSSDSSASQAEYGNPPVCVTLARLEDRAQNEQIKARIQAVEDRLGCR